jgi:uncharacterized protein with HEPN domain
MPPDREAERVVSSGKVLVHGYDQIDDVTTWRFVQTKLPLLREDMHRLLSGDD